MYVRVRHRRRKHGDIIFAVIGWSERTLTGSMKYFEAAYLGSIRRAHLDDPDHLFNFWMCVRDKLLSSFSHHDCDLFFKKIGREIPRPRRLYGTDRGVHFSCYKIRPPYRGRYND